MPRIAAPRQAGNETLTVTGDASTHGVIATAGRLTAPGQRPGVITIDPLAMSGERLYAPPTGIVQSVY